MDSVIVIIELLGTVSFAVSGSLIAIYHQLDLFGVVALGVISSTFGGVFRDIILGSFPPSAFKNPIYVFTAVGVSVLVFIVVYLIHKSEVKGILKKLLFWTDSFGLGLFSAMGVISAYLLYGVENAYLCIFCGLITGVGGGLFRDIVVNRLPAIFVRHIYAIASLCGSIVTYVCLCNSVSYHAIVCGSLTVVVLRFLASHYRWNLPVIGGDK